MEQQPRGGEHPPKEPADDPYADIADPNLVDALKKLEKSIDEADVEGPEVPAKSKAKQPFETNARVAEAWRMARERNDDKLPPEEGGQENQ